MQLDVNLPPLNLPLSAPFPHVPCAPDRSESRGLLALSLNPTHPPHPRLSLAELPDGYDSCHSARSKGGWGLQSAFTILTQFCFAPVSFKAIVSDKPSTGPCLVSGASLNRRLSEERGAPQLIPSIRPAVVFSRQ
jgi:hypothetical protein